MGFAIKPPRLSPRGSTLTLMGLIPSADLAVSPLLEMTRIDIFSYTAPSPLYEKIDDILVLKIKMLLMSVAIEPPKLSITSTKHIDVSQR